MNDTSEADNDTSTLTAMNTACPVLVAVVLSIWSSAKSDDLLHQTHCADADASLAGKFKESK